MSLQIVYVRELGARAAQQSCASRGLSQTAFRVKPMASFIYIGVSPPERLPQHLLSLFALFLPPVECTRHPQNAASLHRQCLHLGPRSRKEDLLHAVSGEHLVDTTKVRRRKIGHVRNISEICSRSVL